MKAVSGDLLISPPNILDPRFNKTVLLLTNFGQGGAFGLCLNKPSDHTVNEIIEPLGLQLPQDIRLYWGGPVKTSTIWMLHDSNWVCQNTLRINEKWSITSHEQMFERLVERDVPDRFRLMFGHAAWGPQQLDMELEGIEPWDHNHSWLVLKDPDPDLLIETDYPMLWNLACDLCSHQAVAEWL